MRTRIAGLIGSAAAMAATVGTASWASASGESPWQPYEQAPITWEAGVACDFEVRGVPVEDREFYRDVAFYPDGDVYKQQWKGPLVIEYTNTETGTSVVRDISGRSTYEYYPDGSPHSLTIQNGRFGASLQDDSMGPGKGLYVVSGKGSALVWDTDGSKALVLGPHGSAENICPDLAE